MRLRDNGLAGLLIVVAMALSNLTAARADNTDVGPPFDDSFTRKHCDDTLGTARCNYDLQTDKSTGATRVITGVTSPLSGLVPGQGESLASAGHISILDVPAGTTRLILTAAFSIEQAHVSGPGRGVIIVFLTADHHGCGEPCFAYATRQVLQAEEEWPQPFPSSVQFGVEVANDEGGPMPEGKLTVSLGIAAAAQLEPLDGPGSLVVESQATASLSVVRE